MRLISVGSLLDWFPDWRGQTAVIVAGGPTAKDAPLDDMKGKCRCIAVNEGYRLAGWADVLYGCDGRWWQVRQGVKGFVGLKISQDLRAVRQFKDIRKVDVVHKDEILVERKGQIGSGGNSGFQAINLAVQFGATRIVLVGFDMRIDRGIHWHGPHPNHLNNPRATNVERWRRAIDGAAGQLMALGVIVVNASQVSELTGYPKMSLLEAVE